jgi:membrane associated rhomboid family serine protease
MNSGDNFVQRREPVSIRRDLGKYLLGLGIGTWMILVFNALVHFSILFIRRNSEKDWSDAFMLCPQYVMNSSPELYRLVSAAFIHASSSHLAMNSLTTLVFGEVLERRLGTAAFLPVTLLSALMCGGVYILLSYISAIFPESIVGQPFTCVIGFSGVLFTYLYLICSYGSEQRTVFCVQVKSSYISWIWLVLVQVVFPNVSLFGHFSGILVGVLFKRRLLGVMLPSYGWLEAFEEWKIVQWREGELAAYTRMTRHT